MQLTQEELTEYFNFIDDLRESGRINMFGAGSYLEEEYPLTKKDARTVMLGWIETFSKEDPWVRAGNYLKNHATPVDKSE